jgi:hypothetical protein
VRNVGPDGHVSLCHIIIEMLLNYIIEMLLDYNRAYCSHAMCIYKCMCEASILEIADMLSSVRLYMPRTVLGHSVGWHGILSKLTEHKQ